MTDTDQDQPAAGPQPRLSAEDAPWDQMADLEIRLRSFQAKIATNGAPRWWRDDAIDVVLRRYDATREERDHARAEARALREALPDPAKLWALADWLDLKYPDDSDPEIQRDLRAWAKRIIVVAPETLTNGVPAVCDSGHSPRLSDQDISAICGVRKKRTALAKREASGGD